MQRFNLQNVVLYCGTKEEIRDLFFSRYEKNGQFKEAGLLNNVKTLMPSGTAPWYYPTMSYLDITGKTGGFKTFSEAIDNLKSCVFPENTHYMSIEDITIKQRVMAENLKISVL